MDRRWRDLALRPGHAGIWADVHELGDNIRQNGVCAEAVAIDDDAPMQDRLLAYLGRDPR